MSRTETLLAYDAVHPAFAGHFPTRPIVPGVLLLDAALHHICTAHDLCVRTCRIVAAKFLSAVGPGEALQLSHVADGQGVVRFELRAASDARLVAAGQVQCAAAQTASDSSP